MEFSVDLVDLIIHLVVSGGADEERKGREEARARAGGRMGERGKGEV